MALKLHGISEAPFSYLDLSIPKHSWVAVTGRMATGKRTLLAKVIYSECQRRFLATLPPYWQHQFSLPQRPQLQRMSGAMPAILWSAQDRSPWGAADTVADLLGWSDAWRRLLVREGQWQCPRHQVAVTHKADGTLPEGLIGKFVALCLPELSAEQLSEEAVTACQRLGFVRLYGEGQLVAIDSNLTPGARYRIVADIVTVKSAEQVAKAAEQVLAALPSLAGEPFVGIGHEVVLVEAFPDMAAKPFDPPLAFGAAGQCPVPGCGFSAAHAGEVGDDFTFGEETYNYFAARRLPADPDRPSEGMGEGLSEGMSEGMGYEEGLRLKVAEAHRLLAQRGLPGDALALSQLQAAVDLGLGGLSCSALALPLASSYRLRLRLCAEELCGASDYLLLLFYPSAGLDEAGRAGLVTRLERLRAQGNTLVVVAHDEPLLACADHILTLEASEGGQPCPRWSLPPKERRRKQPHTFSWQDEPQLPAGYAAYGAEAPAAAAPLPLPLKGCLGIVGPNGAGKTQLLSQLQALLKERAQQDARDTPTLRLFAPSESPKSSSTVATLLGIWQPLRSLYSRLPEAKALGITARDFMTAEYHCPVCQGSGLAHDGPCRACLGSGLSHRLSGIRYRELNLSQLLAGTIDATLPLVSRVPNLRHPLALAARLPKLGGLRLSDRAGRLSQATTLLLQLASFLAQGPKHKRVMVAIEMSTISHLHPADAEPLFTAIAAILKEQERGLIFTCTEPAPYHAPDLWLKLSGPLMPPSCQFFNPSLAV